MNAGARFVAWTHLRASWRRRLVLVLVLGAFGAVAIASAAGAVRTASAVDRFLTVQRAFDFAVSCGPAGVGGAGHACEEELRAVDGIAETAPLITLPGLLSADGRNIEPADDTCWSGPGDVALVVAPDGRFGSAINAHRFIAGRPADPSRAHEIVISRDLARRVALGVGDTIDVELFAGADCLDEPSAWQAPRALTIVGIEVSPFEVRPESGEYRSFIHGTPALLDEVGDLPDAELTVAARLQPDRSLEDLRTPLGQLGVSLELTEGGDARVAIPQSLNADNLRRSSRPYVVAQWLVAGLAAAAGLVLLGQALSRQILTGAADLRVVGHLGLARRDLVAVGAAHVLTVVVPAALVAVIGSFLASPLTPLGVARVVEPNPGWHLDVPVTALGGVLLLATVLCVAAPAVVLATRPPARGFKPRSGRAGALARQMGAGPVSSTGLRMAFEPLRGPTAPPLRTGFGVVLGAVIVLVAATVFGGSLNHLLVSKHLVGWNWDAFIGTPDESPEALARFEEIVAATPGVAESTSGTFFSFIEVGEEAMWTPSFSAGPIAPTIVSGRAPRGPGEIVLGRETLSRLGYQVDDRIPVMVMVGEDEEVDAGQGTAVHSEATIVGIAVLPSVGGDGRLGTGSAVAFDLFRAADPGRLPDAVYLRLEPGADLDEVLASIAAAFGVDEVEAISDDFLGSQLLNLEQVENLPIVVAAMLALLAVGVVGQVIVGSTHARRGEFGVLRALGLRPQQMQAAVVIQALALSASVLVIGLPLGIALGRTVWQQFALSLGTKPEVSVDVAWLVALSVALLLFATIFALIGSARPRRQLSGALRRE